ncbi:hypothetical protein C3F09_07020 [candidate division GN15 bacterium]|uniref:DUF6249 domain-containing protein n=1 Tax=candidate division GN15 bacterium TaxID=2072418 RepID=A0A855X0C5_9BACT|nr:MAG: hypothetical protein C3F09_07020 [candidate division GN15 bacterium]
MDIDVTAILITFIVFGSVVSIIRAVGDHRVKMRYLEKGPDDLPTKPIDLNLGNGYGSSLKWGLVCLFVGLALFLMEMMPQYFEEEAVLGGMFIAAGVALLLYYLLTDKKKKQLQQS